MFTSIVVPYIRTSKKIDNKKIEQCGRISQTIFLTTTDMLKITFTTENKE